MSNSEYREAQQQAREHGLKARHEQRLENATYTAAEVKVLTEAALRLGRKEAAEQIAVGIAEHRREFTTGSAIDTELFVAQEIALMVASQPSPDATSGRTDPGMEALREVADLWYSDQGPWNMHGSEVTWLRERADKLEGRTSEGSS